MSYCAIDYFAIDGSDSDFLCASGWNQPLGGGQSAIQNRYRLDHIGSSPIGVSRVFWRESDAYFLVETGNRPHAGLGSKTIGGGDF